MTTVTGPSRVAWLEWRRQGIGASDAAALVGLHPWVSPMSVYFDKRGEINDEQEPTEAMEWGLRLEQVVAEAWAEKNQRPIQRFQPYSADAMRVHPEHPWMQASLDALVIADDSALDFADRGDLIPEAVLELKTASGWATHDWEEGVPPHVIVQAQWQLAVMDLPVAYVACLVGGQKFVQDVVERDDEMIAGLIKAGGQFWQQIQAGIPPAVDAHPNTADVLKARWHELLDDAVELGAEGFDMVKEWHEAKPMAKAAGERLATVENRLRLALAEHQVATVYGDIACTWKADKNNVRRLNVKEL